MRYTFLKDLLITSLIIMFHTNSYAKTNNNIDINYELYSAMQAYHVPVVGYAIIQNYKIVAVKTLSIDSALHVNDESLFQAASISKSVAAYGALKLISQDKLNLNESVNEQLATWKIPTSKYGDKAVTVRELLDMTSGLTVSGYPGHAQGEQLPTLKQILNGESSANTPPVRLFYKPGTKYYYSGGAYQVLEQLIEDVVKQPFKDWMENEVLKPVEMNNSFFQDQLSKELSNRAIPAFLNNGTMIKDGWYNYASASAAGLWSTPTDLAKFSINISNSYLGKINNVISKSTAEKMLTRNKNTDFGLGVVINGSDKTLNFRKAGHNLGYHNELIMFPNTGDGVVIMTNSENGEAIINYAIPLIAIKYHWPCFFPYFDELIPIPQQAC